MLNLLHQGSKRTHNIDAVQMLRAIAALLVVIWHSRLSIMHATNNYWIEGDFSYRAVHYPSFLNHLDIGVDIFFCISGFIMNMLIRDEPSTVASAAGFVANRAIRIFPPYWFFTALVLVAYVVSRGRYNLASLSGEFTADEARLVTSLLLIPDGLPPVLGVAWTLVHEGLFYLLCGLAIALGFNRRLPAALAIMSILSLVLLGAHVSLFHGYGMNSFLIEFFCGALAYEYRNFLSHRFFRVQLALAIGLYLVLSTILDTGIDVTAIAIVRPVVAGLMGILLICGLIGTDDRLNLSNSPIGSGLLRIGAASYSLYLSHWLVLSAMGKLIWLVPNLPTPIVAAWHVLSVLVAVTFAVIFAEQVELPVHRRLQAVFHHVRTLPVASR